MRRRRKSAASSRSSFVCKMLLLVNIASIACGLNAAPIPPFPKKDPALMLSDDHVELKVSSGNSESKMTIWAQNKDKLSFKAIRPSHIVEHHVVVATLEYGNCKVDLSWTNVKESYTFSVRSFSKDVNGSPDVDVTLKDGYSTIWGSSSDDFSIGCKLDFSPASDGQGGYVIDVSLKGNDRSEIKLQFDSEYKPYVPRTTPKPAATREPPSEGLPGYIIAIIIVSALAVAVSLLLGIAVAVYYCFFKKKGYRWDGTKTTEIYQTATPGTKMRTGTTQPTPTPIIAVKTSKNSKDKNMKKPSEPAISPKKSEANVKTPKQKCIELNSKHEANDKTQNLKCIELYDEPRSHAKQKSSSTVHRLVNGSSVTRLSPTTLEMQSAEDRRIRDKKATAAKEADDKKRREKRIADRIKEKDLKLDKTSEWQPKNKKPAPLFMNTVCTQPESTNESSRKSKVETKQKLQKKQEDTSDTTENSSFWVKTIDSEAQD